MATYDEVQAARGAVLAKLAEVLGFRPEGSGIVRQSDGGYALKIYLPRETTSDLSANVLGVPVEYDILRERPRLL
jgi:hypothetical protein